MSLFDCKGTPDFNEIFKEAAEFAKKVLAELEMLGLTNEFDLIDHVCYRVDTLKAYEKWKKFLEVHGHLLSEAYINSRPVATYKLSRPIKVNEKYSIDLFELPAPKKGRSYPVGFEHIEVVSLGRLEELVAKFEKLHFNEENMRAAVNPDIALELNCGLVKFHEKSLESVIEQEKKDFIESQGKYILLIDFDDTLVNSKEQFIEACYRSLCQYLSQKINKEEFLKNMRPTFPEVFSRYGISRNENIWKVIKVFQQESEKLEEMITIPDEIESTLSCFYNQGIEIVIWTARDADSAKKFIHKTNLGKYIKKTIGFESKEVGKPKVSDELFKCIQNKRVLVLGDSNSDLEGAHAIGASFFQAAWFNKKDLGVSEEWICHNPFDFLGKSIRFLQS